MHMQKKKTPSRTPSKVHRLKSLFFTLNRLLLDKVFFLGNLI